MVLGLRIIHEILQALLRVWNEKDEGNLLENAAQTSTASGDEAASQSPETPSGPANVQTRTHQRPENTNQELSDPGVHIDALRRRSWGYGGTAKTTPPGQGAAIFRLAQESSAAGEKKLPEIRSKRSGEANWQSRPATSPLVRVAT
ncbi:hypothetical protein G5V57_28695 [Nordella sp. HKS 07]|uniref:hypothetical protein n=1 Tax=Nordella sp. HKS 07 TaxID=2712222 RepID=UPI0013E10569|nr:hypothetical protein [Nordella sp. HKS 07]QIG51343.1 hypothetical protein G5V57_28695 [Nordella sp. HKS 07]